MNRLKYVLGIQVPRPIPSNTTFFQTQSKGAIKKHQSEVYVSKSTERLTAKPKKPNEFRDFHCAGQIRNGDGLMQQPEYVQKHRNLTNQCKRSHNVKRYSARNAEKLVNSTKETRNIKPELLNKDVIEKESRSYAQMIQCYSELLSASNPIAVPKDNFSSTMVNRIHRSPFSTVSAVSQKPKIKSKGSKNGNICGPGLNTFRQDVKFSSEASTIRCGNRRDNKNFHDTTGENAFEKPCLSYAKMIEKYSNSLSLDIGRYNRTGNLIPKRNVSTKLHKIQPLLMDSKGINAKSFPPSSKSGTVNESKRRKAETKNEEAWVTKVDDVINDSKEGAIKRDSMELNSKEKWMLQSVNEPAHWLDRVVNAHKNRIPEKQWVSENTPLDMIMPQNNAQDATLQTNKHHELTKKLPPVVASKNPTNPMAEYIKRGPGRTSTLSQSSTQSPTIAETKSAQQPQIELRMTPSQNESVVSINVDEPAARSAGAANRDHLSVIISSKRNKGANVEGRNANPETDYGTMRVSISENTIPVKQIEFSINGKPVSELKSIVARADKLDVFSSMDKVEIRIPPRTDASVSNERVENVVSTATKPTPVLNLQIAAKFSEPRFQQPKSAESKTDAPHVPTSPPTSAPRSPPTPSAPPTPSSPPKPARPQNLFNPNTTNSSQSAKGESKESEITKVVKNVDTTNVISSQAYKNVNRTENDGTVSVDDSQVPVKKENVQYVTRTAQPTKESDKADIQRANETVASKSSPSQSSITDNQTSITNKTTKDNRTPSKIIPWWSAENSFAKIRKENETSNTVPSLNGALLPKNVAPKEKEDLIDAMKIDTPGNSKINVSGKNAIANEDDKSIEISKPLVSVVRVRSPQRWVPMRPKTGAKLTKYSKPRNVVSNRTIKRTKYRVKSSLYSSTSVKKDSETSPASPVHSPKVIKYISVTPQKANVAKNPEIKVSTANMEQKTNDSKHDGQPKKENSKSEKGVVVKGADTQRVPSESNPSATKVDFGANRKKKQGRMETLEDRNLSSRDVNEDRRIKEILKSMKPIEKRKDGTLIDYGVVVPSRKPLGNIRQIPKIPNKTPINVISKETVTRQGKIAEPVNVSSTKKQDLSEPRNVLDQTKIVEPKKIPSENKPVAAASSVQKLETTKVSDASLMEPPTKPVVENKEQKPIFALKKDNVDVQNVSEPAEKKPSVKTVTGSKEGKPAVTVKKDDSKVEKVIATAPNLKQVADFPDKNRFSNSVTATVTGKLPFEGTVPNPLKTSDKITDNTAKSAMNNKTESVPSKNAGAPNTWRRFREKEQKDGPKPKEQKKAPFEGTVTSPSKIVDKTTKKANSTSLSRSQSAPPKVNTKYVNSNNPLEKEPKGNSTVPFEGTINHQPPDKQKKNSSSINIRKVTTKLDDSKRNDLSTSNTSKTSTDKGNGNAGTSHIVASSSLKLDTTYCKEGLINNNEKEGENDHYSTYTCKSNSPYVSLMSEPERPEKNMLYSSWLQRFKDKFGDNKII